MSGKRIKLKKVSWDWDSRLIYGWRITEYPFKDNGISDFYNLRIRGWLPKGNYHVRITPPSMCLPILEIW